MKDIGSILIVAFIVVVILGIVIGVVSMLESINYEYVLNNT